MINTLSNIRLDANSKNKCIKDNKSIIGFDFTMNVPAYDISENGDLITILFKDINLNMPSGIYNDEDGLIKIISLKMMDNSIIAEIKLLFRTGFEIKKSKGIPSSLNIYLDRSPIRNILQNKKIILNPTHKKLTKSPTNLMPYIPMEAIANKLKTLLTISNASVQLTKNDYYKNNITNEDFNGDILINLDTEYSVEDNSGFKVYYAINNIMSKDLALTIDKTIERKSPLKNIGIFPKSYDYKNNNILIITVIPALENIRLDDAHLRDIEYRNKISQGIFNGLIEYYNNLSKL